MKIIIFLVASVVALETAVASPCYPYEIPLCCTVTITAEAIARCISLTSSIILPIFASSLVAPLHLASLAS
jgi:hypothetical protein